MLINLRPQPYVQIVIGIIIVLAAAGGLTIRHSAAQTSEDISSDYTWQPLKTGAGGWVTGINIHPDGEVVYARTDVGGAYRWEESTSTWQQIVTAASMPDAAFDSYSGVVSLVAAPSDADRAYMAFRDAIYRSDDRGESWTKTSLTGLRDISNGPGRQQGERLAVDPVDADIVYFGSAAQGLFRSEDGGENWTAVPESQVPLSGEDEYGVGNVQFASSSVIYATVHAQGVYRSTDAGQGWQKIAGGAGPADGRFQHIDIASDSTLYLAMAEPGSVWKLQDDTWTDISPSGDSFATVAVAPNDPEKVFAFRNNGDAWRSLNGGATWEALTKSRTATDIPWLGWTDEEWMSVGNIVFDPVVPDRLWFSEGVGVWRTTDINDDDIEWVSVSAGIEELVTSDVVAPPGGQPVTAHWDRALFYHADPDEYPTEHGPTSRFNSGWDLDYAVSDADFVVAVVQDHRECCSQWDGPDNQSGYSEDGGQTWNLFPSLANETHPEELKFGNIAVAANDTDNLVWLPSYNKALHYSTDGGQNWTPVILPGTEDMQDDDGNYDGGSHFQYYLRRKVLAADPVRDNTFYLYHRDNGIYRSSDGGATWENLASTDLPTGWAVGWFNATLKAVSGKAGHLFWTPGLLSGESFPLYRSTDGGATWEALDSTSDVTTFGFGTGETADDDPVIYMQGKVDGEPGVWRSTDSGTTWEQIATYPLGIYDRITAIDGDKDVFGTVYMGFGGTGFVYGRLTDNPDSQPTSPGTSDATTTYLPLMQQGAGDSPIPSPTPPVSGTVEITVAYDTPTDVSQLAIGATHTRFSLDTGGTSQAAIDQAKDILGQTTRYQNQHIMGWGALNPNPAPDEYDWATLDSRIDLIRSMDTEPVITLCCAPDWMKGGQPGETDWDDLEKAPLPEHFDDFADLAARVAERYPDVQYFQVWNEMKGFWDAPNQNWDYRAYTTLYNKVYDAVKAVRPDAKIGGLYLVIEGTGSNKGGWAAEEPIRARQWDVIDYWLENKNGADFLCIDRGLTDFHDDNSYSVAERMELTRHFGEVVRQLRERTDLPIWWSEWYTGRLEPHDPALTASTLMHMVESGSTVALLWNPMQTGEAGHPLFTDVREDGGGEPTILYDVFVAFNTHFGPDTQLYQATSSATDVKVLASETNTLLINQRADAVTVSLNGATLTLDGYEVRLVER